MKKFKILNSKTRILSFRSLLSHITNMLHLFMYHFVPVGRTRDNIITSSVYNICPVYVFFFQALVHNIYISKFEICLNRSLYHSTVVIFLA